MILKSTDYTYTTCDSQAILLQATPTPSHPISNKQLYYNEHATPTQPTIHYTKKQANF